MIFWRSTSSTTTWSSIMSSTPTECTCRCLYTRQGSVAPSIQHAHSSHAPAIQRGHSSGAHELRMMYRWRWHRLSRGRCSCCCQLVEAQCARPTSFECLFTNLFLVSNEPNGVLTLFVSKNPEKTEELGMSFASHRHHNSRRHHNRREGNVSGNIITLCTGYLKQLDDSHFTPYLPIG